MAFNGVFGRFAGLPLGFKTVSIFGITISIIFFIFKICHLGGVIEIGGDEYFAVNKALLWTRGYSLYSQIWDNQPPFHTMLLGVAFKYLGTSIGVARFLSACFGFLLILALFLIVKKRCGTIASIIAVFVLITAPYMFGLTVSVMPELPAMTTALWSAWSLFLWAENGRPRWLVLSGALMASALQFKLTAAILIPPILIELFLFSVRESFADTFKSYLRNLAIWSAVVVVLFLLVGWLVGVDYKMLWISNTVITPQAERRQFNFGFLLREHREALFGSGAALIIAAISGNWRKIIFPLELLAIVLVIHIQHSPWWYYYYIHFALPLAWLTGYGVAELYWFVQIDVKERHSLSLSRAVCFLAASGILFLSIYMGVPRLRAEIVRIQRSPRLANCQAVNRMKEFSGMTKWVYTPGSIYPFLANLPLIPELAELPFKRFWSGEINENEILKIVKRYQPEQLLLSNETLAPNWSRFIENSYTLVYVDSEVRLYLANGVLPLGTTLRRCTNSWTKYEDR